jgi:glycosyltransferase involved in cell wall biosynthesis
MFRNRLYYELKPYLPYRFRIAVRRAFAGRIRQEYADVWPIHEAAGKPPDGWPGWPDGKKFAFVLTHDVEGPEGLAKCRDLMKLEMDLGFRSCFNFIPEGDYIVPAELREELTQNGFEVGVHDLHHDGRLYSNRRDFLEKAAWINRYLKEWGAVGFRAGFMFRNLEWHQDLNILYGSCTFDTDPFEPQPDGIGTIFPCWIPRLQPGTQNLERGTSQGYLELPYTLPQDSTLFLLLRETTPDIWHKKLDWVAERGGMALVNVHPDYIQFQDEAASPQTYPVSLYEELLRYTRERYGRSYWNPLPRELAGFAAGIRPPLPRKHRRICMVSYSHYQTDTRVMRYAEALAQRGDHVDMVTLRSSAIAPSHEQVSKVNVYHIQSRYGKHERSRLSFLLPLLRFLCISSWWITRRHARKPYDLLHIHNVPDFLVFAAWYPKLTGARVILDIHDIIPEFYGSKFNKQEGALSVTLLKRVERLSARFADRVIIANHLWIEKYANRTGANGKCSVLINNVDMSIFRPRPRTRNDRKVIILFPGGLQWHQGLDIAIRAFRKVRAELPNAEFHIYGNGDMKLSLIALASELGLNGKVRFFDPLPVSQVAEVMANADLGVVPKRADSFGNEAYSTKIMEFMSLGIPVVVSNTKIDRYYFDESVVRFFESGNPEALADAMLDVLRNNNLSGQMVSRAADYAARNNWESKKNDYIVLVDSLCVR